MSSSPSALTENQKSPPAAADSSTGNAAISNANSESSTSPSASASESKVPPPLLSNQKSGGSGHRRRVNSNQQQPLYQAQFVEPIVYDQRLNPNYYPNLYSYSTDFGDVWGNAGANAGFMTDISMWPGPLQSPNDIVFAYPPHYPSFGFASPDGITQPMGGPSPYNFDGIPGQQQQQQPQAQPQTSPMINGKLAELNQRLGEMTLSVSDAGGNEGEGAEQLSSDALAHHQQQQQQGRNSTKRSSKTDDSASRSWASIASPQLQQQSWGSNGRSSANSRQPVVLDVMRTSENDMAAGPINDGAARMQQRHVSGILPYPHSARMLNDDHQRNFGGGLQPSMIEPRAIYNQHHVQAQSLVAEELCRKNDYNPKEFKLDTKNARYFVIKSFAEDDVFSSVKFSVWCSTVRGNERLDKAFRSNEGPIYLFYSVNNTGNFCGVAQMISSVDFQKDAGCWSAPRWKGAFTVKWIYIKDIPFREFKEITLENNEGKPVFKSRDTQEVPPDLGVTMLRIFHNYRSQTTLFDDFTYYEEKAAAGMNPNNSQPLQNSISQNGTN